jgi:serine/threonine-protein kinase
MTHLAIPAAPRVLSLSAHRHVEVQAPIGSGSVGAVYRGELHDRGGSGTNEAGGSFPREERFPVAVKMFPRIRPEDRLGALKRLAYVLGCASHVDHPNVVGVFDYVTDAPDPFAVLELVEGQSVQQLLACRERELRGPDMAVGLYIATRAAQGLSGALTARGTHGPLRLIHGELSPRSVLVSRAGEVKVGDFGLSMALGCESAQLSVSDLVSRMRYLAPEIARGSGPNERADVFSLGVLLYELVCGPRIHPNATAAEAMALVQDGVVPVSLVEPQLPGQLRQLIRRAVDRDPAKRYPDATALAHELQRLSQLMGIVEPPRELREELTTALAEELAAEDLVYQAEVVDWDMAPTIVDNRGPQVS